MKKKITFLTILACLLSCQMIWAWTPTSTTFSGGDGTAGNPYLISTKADLEKIGTSTSYWGNYFKMTADIDLTGTTYTKPIIAFNNNAGAGAFYNTQFTGSFNGDGHKIIGLTIVSDRQYTGLFGYCNGATLSNLTLQDCNISENGAYGVMAGLCGESDGSSVFTNCHVSGTVTGGKNLIGGLCGLVRDAATFTNCSSTAAITLPDVDSNNQTAGGLIGYIAGGVTINRCFATGNVTGNYQIGGLIGSCTSSTITDCYARGNVNGSGNYFGGLVGYSSSNTLTNCYSAEAVPSSVTYSWGLTGYFTGSNTSNCFWDTDVSAKTWSGGGATGKTTAEMKTQATFIGWDFATTPVWKIDGINNGGYPHLAWQNLAAPEIDLNQGTTAIASGTGAYAFGNQTTSTNTDVVFTIANTGTVASTLGSFTITGANADQFSLQGTTPTTVAASGTATFTVRFAPTSAGAKTATVSFANQDGDENPYSFTITGTGTAPMQLVFTTTAANQAIALPLFGTVNCTVNWGDGSAPEAFTTTGEQLHAFAAAGTYTVKISGELTQFGKGASSTGIKYLTEVVSFGDLGLTSLSGAFYDADNLTSVPATLPATVTDLSNCFNSINQVSIMNLDSWNTNSVTNMNLMFRDAKKFNQNIGAWNVSNVISMKEMFSNIDDFNQDISNWDVGKVTDMSAMFNAALSFDQPIGKWNVSNVETMESMFALSAFNQPLATWNVGKVKNMFAMFGMSPFNQDISAWNVGNVTNISYMFYGATAFDQNLSTWNISSVTTMEEMFTGVTLSTANYDALLKSWAAQTVQSNVIFGGGNSKYSAGAAATARGVLTGAPNSWIITDGGIVKTTPVITWSNPTDIIHGTKLSATQLNATADVAGAFEYSAAIDSVLAVGDNQMLTCTFTPTDAANYATVSDTVYINVKNDETNAVKEETNLSLSIYPNPAINYIHINGIGTHATVTITDLNGRTCLMQEIDADNNIQLNGLVKGIYLLSIEKEGVNSCLKLIKE